MFKVGDKVRVIDLLGELTPHEKDKYLAIKGCVGEITALDCDDTYPVEVKFDPEDGMNFWFKEEELEPTELTQTDLLFT